MTTGVELQALAPGTAHADLGFWLQSQIIGQPMAMHEPHLSAIVESILANRFSLPRSRSTGARITEKGTAIVEIHGVLINRAPVIGSFWGLTAYEGLGEQFRRLATNADVKRIVLDVDSPGGLVAGIRTCADALEDLAEQKPVYGIAHDMACSAGYWLACIAEELSVTPDGDVGSIGVRGGHVSYAELLERAGIDIRIFKGGAAKADHAISELLTDAAAAEMKHQIDRQHERFISHVARHRSLSDANVRATDARVWAGQDAVAAGLADQVETLEALVERIEKNTARVKPKRKTATDRSSKGGLAPAPRNPAPQGPDDEAPSAGKTKGALHMPNQVAADGADALAAAITDAIKGIAAKHTPAPVATPPAPAPAAAAAAPAPQADVAAETSSRIFAIIDSDEGKARPALARTLAGNAKLSADEAKQILAASAVETPAAPAPAAQLGDALERKMALPGNAAGVLPEANAKTARPDFVAVAEATAKKKG